MRSTTKDIILLCKGYYDKEKYPTLLDALKEYYRKYYSDQYEEFLSEKYLLKCVIIPAVMCDIAINYPDRLRGFIMNYLCSNFNLYDISEKDNDYYSQLFYRITKFLSGLQMRGDGLKEIDTSDYFETVDSSNEVKRRMIIEII